MRKLLGALVLVSPLALLAACEGEDPGMQQDETAIQEEPVMQEEATLGDEQGGAMQEEQDAAVVYDEESTQ